MKGRRWETSALGRRRGAARGWLEPWSRAKTSLSTGLRIGLTAIASATPVAHHPYSLSDAPDQEKTHA